MNRSLKKEEIQEKYGNIEILEPNSKIEVEKIDDQSVNSTVAKMRAKLLNEEQYRLEVAARKK